MFGHSKAEVKHPEPEPDYASHEFSAEYIGMDIRFTQKSKIVELASTVMHYNFNLA
jgi:hypothetical protein